MPGTKVNYYKGQLQKEEFSIKRMSDAPHYFGVAIVGNKEEDFIKKKGKKPSLKIVKSRKDK